MTVLTVRRKLAKSIIDESLRASSILSPLAYDPKNETFVMDDQSHGFVFQCEPLTFGDEKVQQRVVGFLNQDYPPGSTIQFLLYRSPDINKRIHQMMRLRENFHHPLTDEVMASRRDFLIHHTIEPISSVTNKGVYNLGIVQDLKLFVSFKTPISGNLPTEAETTQLKELQIKVKSGLQTVGLRPVAVEAAEYIRMVSSMVNWSPDAPWRHDSDHWDDGVPICEQIFDYDTDLEVSKDYLRLGDHYAKVLSAKKLPEAYFFGDAVQYVGDLLGTGSSVRENYAVCVNLHYPVPEKKKAGVSRKRQMVVNQAYGPMLKFVPVLAEKLDSFNLMNDSLVKGFRPIEFSYTVTVFAPTVERVTAAANQLRNLWRELRFEIMEDKFAMLPCFINTVPLCTDAKAINDLFRYKTMTTEHAPVLLPIFGEWKGTGTFHSNLISRNGQLMSLSLHDSNTNKNAVIAAESGSGKSFLVNELIMSYLSEGAQVWVIDVGRSYEKLCGTLNGDFVHFEESTDVSLNPFPLIENYTDEEDAIVSLLAAMASAKGTLTEFQIASLKQIVGEEWEKHQKELKIDHIAERCRKHPDSRVNDVGAQLYPFTSKGSYGRFFSRDNNVSFQNQFTVLELDDLQGRKHLRQVVLLQLIYQIQQEVFLGERNRKKVVIIDEAWDLLKEGEVSVFMEHAYRKFRKYGGSVVIATQSINDLYENAVGRAIAENSSSMYLLGQTEETVESIKRTGRLSLSEGGYRMLKTVHTILGVYSEIFVKSNAGVGVGRLVVGDFQKLLYSSDPNDVQAIKQKMAGGMDTATAIKAVIEDRRKRLN